MHTKRDGEEENEMSWETWCSTCVDYNGIENKKKTEERQQ